MNIYHLIILVPQENFGIKVFLSHDRDSRKSHEGGYCLSLLVVLVRVIPFGHRAGLRVAPAIARCQRDHDHVLRQFNGHLLHWTGNYSNRAGNAENCLRFVT
jgi:hypothetical protein